MLKDIYIYIYIYILYYVMFLQSFIYLSNIKNTDMYSYIQTLEVKNTEKN